jgi:hypothetical protein
MWALGDVHPGELQIESSEEDALDSIMGLLRCCRHDGSADDVSLLFAKSKAVSRHSKLWACALRSRALVTALAASWIPARVPLARTAKACWSSQMAMLHVNQQYTCSTFWQELARHGTKTLHARASANTLYACAKPAS